MLKVTLKRGRKTKTVLCNPGNYTSPVFIYYRSGAWAWYAANKLTSTALDTLSRDHAITIISGDHKDSRDALVTRGFREMRRRGIEPAPTVTNPGGVSGWGASDAPSRKKKKKSKPKSRLVMKVRRAAPKATPRARAVTPARVVRVPAEGFLDKLIYSRKAKQSTVTLIIRKDICL